MIPAAFQLKVTTASLSSISPMTETSNTTTASDGAEGHTNTASNQADGNTTNTASDGAEGDTTTASNQAEGNTTTTSNGGNETTDPALTNPSTNNPNNNEGDGNQGNNDQEQPPGEGERNRETRARYKAEKEVLEFRPPPPSIFKNLKGSYWGLVYHIDWVKLRKYRDDNSPVDTTDRPGLRKCLKVLKEGDDPVNTKDKTLSCLAKRLAICPLCFDDPDASLFDAVIGCGNHDSSSNINQHRLRKHKEEVEKKTREEAIMEKQGQKKMSSFVSTTVTRATVRNEFQKKIYEFVNDMGFPSRTVEKPAFRSLLSFAISNANLLRPSDASISNRAMTSMRIDSYNSFLREVNNLGDNIRETFKSWCGKRIRFACLAHDVWQGCKKDILGVTLILPDPRNCNVYKIPIGLLQTKGHSAAQVADHTETILNQVGFTRLDLCASINDNTNSAVLAGKYITGMEQGGKCDMHRAELILKHATGQAIRKRGRVVIDENKEFLALYKVFHLFASWLMSKKARARFENLRSFAKQNGRIIVEIQLPNGTRVMGCLIMFHGLLRNKFIMDDYARSSLVNDNEFRSKYPSVEDWKQLAEYEGILQPLQSCAMTLQTDDPSAASASLVEIFLSKYAIEQMQKKGVRILDVETSPWDASLTIKKLDSKRVRRAHDLLLVPSQDLILRILREYRHYMMESKDVDAEKAMLSNPLLCTSGPLLFKKIGFFKDTDIERIEKNFMEDCFEKYYSPAPEPATNQGTGTTSNAPSANNNNSAPSNDSETNGNGENNLVTADDDDASGTSFDIFDDIDLAVDDTTADAGDNSNTGNNEVDRANRLEKLIKEEYRDYKRFCERKVRLQWTDLINQYPTSAYLEDLTDWKDPKKKWFAVRCKKQDFTAVGKYFDVMAWWDANKTNYPRLFPTAIVWLSKPATNAFQERVFSCSSWLDSNRLMRKESPHNFQIRSLTCVSRPVRAKITEAEKELIKRPKAIQQVITELHLDSWKERDVIEIHDNEPTGGSTTATGAAATSVGVVSGSATDNSPADHPADGVRVDAMLDNIKKLEAYLKQKETEDVLNFGFLDDTTDDKEVVGEKDLAYADSVEIVDLTGGLGEKVLDDTVDDDELLVSVLKQKQGPTDVVVVLEQSSNNGSATGTSANVAGITVNTTSDSMSAMSSVTGRRSTTTNKSTTTSSSRKRKAPPTHQAI